MASEPIEERFKAFLAPEQDTPEPEPTPEIEAESSTEVEQDPVEGVETDETEAEVTEDVQKYTIKVDGEDVEVELPELLRGYSRTSDYTRKTQQLAENRKALDAELEGLRAERAQMAERLRMFDTPQEPNIDWDKLYEEDPIEYVRQKELQRDRKEQLQTIQAEREKLERQQQEEQQKQVSAYVAAESERLLDAIPAWTDEKKAGEEKAKIVSHAKSLGFNDQELGTLYDHRAVVALRESMLYRQMMSKAKAQKEAVREAPKAAKPGIVKGTDNSEFNKARERLRKSGRHQDFADAFKTFIR